VTRAGYDLLIATYTKILVDAGVRPHIVDVHTRLPGDEILSHCLWVLEERIEPILQRIGGFEEAARLLGCIQGVLMALRLCTIADSRKHATEAGITTWDQIVGKED
jgi:hypothetical protein